MMTRVLQIQREEKETGSNTPRPYGQLSLLIQIHFGVYFRYAVRCTCRNAELRNTYEYDTVLTSTPLLYGLRNVNKRNNAYRKTTTHAIKVLLQQI